jgi:hypothetical protein
MRYEYVEGNVDADGVILRLLDVLA